MTDVETRLQNLSETKRVALLRLLAHKDAGVRVLELEGSNLKQLRAGEGPALFLFPATEGSVGYMSGYLPHVPPEWSVFGCQTPGLDGERAPHRTVEEIAAHNVEQIRRVQPDGPYYLSGNCMGGLPAFEAAQQLRAAGQEVALVLHLMPTFDRPWEDLPASGSLHTRALIDYGFIIERLLGEPVDLPVAEIAEAPEEERIGLAVDFLSGLPGLAEVEPELLRHRIEVYLANLGAMFAYRPAGASRFPLRVISVGQQARNEGAVDPASPYAAALRAAPEDVTITPVDAEASTLFDCAEPHMSAVGSVIRAVLTEAARQHGAA